MKSDVLSSSASDLGLGLVEMGFDLAALASRAGHRGCERLPSPTERSLSPGRDSGSPSQQSESTPMLQTRARPDSNGSIPIAYPDGAGGQRRYVIYLCILRNAGFPMANEFVGPISPRCGQMATQRIIAVTTLYAADILI
jgi:hypothetical protein